MTDKEYEAIDAQDAMLELSEMNESGYVDADELEEDGEIDIDDSFDDSDAA